MELAIVDDEPNLAALLCAIFELKGDKATALTSMEEAETWFSRNSCDAVILDIGMPGDLDGLTLIPKIRKSTPRAPIIIFTGMGYDSDTMQRALASGANGYVSKGMPPEEVYVAVQRSIAQMRRQIR